MTAFASPALSATSALISAHSIDMESTAPKHVPAKIVQHVTEQPVVVIVKLAGSALTAVNENVLKINTVMNATRLVSAKQITLSCVILMTESANVSRVGAAPLATVLALS